VAAQPGPSIGALRGAVDLSSLIRPAAPPAGAPAVPPESSAAPDGTQAPAAAPGLAFQVADADFARVVELSSTVPVVVAVTATWSTPSGEVVATLERVIASLGGRMVLAIVDRDESPQLAAAFQAQSVPTVAAVIAGQPVPLFAGSAPEEQVRPLLDQVLQLAVQHGVTGTLPGYENAEAAPEPVEAPLPPHHAEAYAAIDKGDYATAAQEFRTAIAQDPRDAAAVAALAQVELLQRLESVDAAAVRQAAAENPDDVTATLAVADLDVSGGHVDDAFDRILTLFPRIFGADRDAARGRLLAYFEIVGVEDPRVAAARRRLTMLLY
jgi:putative thioredoxin